MESQAQTFQAPVPPPQKWWTRLYFWQFVAAGVLALACIFVFVFLIGNVGGWRRAHATVSMTDAYAYSVTFDTPDGTYTHVEHSNVPIRDVKNGQKLLFRYRTDDPTVIQPYGTAVVLGVCLAVAAIVLASIALALWREERRKQAGWARVRQDGVAVTAAILSVFRDYSGLTKRSRTQFSRLDCTYRPPEGAVYQNESGQSDIWVFTSERFLSPAQKFGGTVTVYVIPNAPDDYYVDLTTLAVSEVLDEPLDDTPNVI